MKATAVQVKHTLRSTLSGLLAGVRGESYSKSHLELAKLYGATTPGSLDPVLESAFASMPVAGSSFSPLSWRAASLLEALNRSFLDVTDNVQLFARDVIDQLILPTEGWAAACTSAAGEANGSAVIVPTHIGPWQSTEEAHIQRVWLVTLLTGDSPPAFKSTGRESQLGFLAGWPPLVPFGTSVKMPVRRYPHASSSVASGVQFLRRPLTPHCCG